MWAKLAAGACRQQDQYVPSSFVQLFFTCANVLKCDKKGRDDDDDPCSECRWFGGSSHVCSLTAETSYNDQLWNTMLLRPQFNFDLPKDKNRAAPIGKNKIPSPMPDDKVKRGWKGETKEKLLAKPDMLPDYVRTLPRAYLVPPRKSITQKKKQDNKRKRANGDSNTPLSSHMVTTPFTPASFFSIFPPPQQTNPDSVTPFPSPVVPTTHTPASFLPPFAPPLFTRPPTDPQHGEVVATSWSWINMRWEHTYATGLRCSVHS